MDRFDVVAAVIIKNNKFFIAQRNRHKHMGLSWEFPGGKVEKGETFELALKREIKEELNIDISSNCVAPLTFAIDYHNTHQTILMLNICRKWQGRPESLLGQKLQWVKPINLVDYEMPKANVFLKSMLRDLIATT